MLQPVFVAKITSLATASQLRLNMASGLVATLVTGGATMLSYPVFVYFLGLELYGLWLVLAAAMQVALLGDLGVGPALTKIIAELAGNGSPPVEEQRAIERHIATATVLMAAVGSAIAATSRFAAAPVIGMMGMAPEQADQATRLLPILGVLTAYALFGLVYHATLAGLGRIDLANYIAAGCRAAGVLLSIALVFVGGGIESMVIGAAFTCVTAHAGYVIALRRFAWLRIMPHRLPAAKELRKLLGFGGGVFAASMLHQSVGPMNKLLLGAWCGMASIPIFEIAFRTTMQSRALGEVALKALMPEFSRSSAADAAPADRIRGLERRARRLMLLTSGPCYAALLLAAEPLLRFWLSEELAVTLAPVLRVMLIGSVVNLLAAPAYYALLGFGRVNQILIAAILFAGINAGGAVAVALLFGSVTPLSIAIAILTAKVTTSLYLMQQRRRLVDELDTQRRVDAASLRRLAA